MSPIRFALLLLAGFAATPARAAIIITVVPSLGPNADPSYDNYGSNAVAALGAGATSAGTPNTPAYYQALGSTPIPLTSVVVTDFPSWRGNANPVGAFGPAFANELGTRLFFGLIVRATPGTQFSISQLSFSATTTDPTHTLDFSYAPGDFDYTENYVGLRLNPDGTVRERITSGLNTQLVDALIARGPSNAFEVLADPGTPNQTRINQAIPASPFGYTATFAVEGVSGSATVNVVMAAEPTPVPAPPSCVLLGFGLAGLALRRWQPRWARPVSPAA